MRQGILQETLWTTRPATNPNPTATPKPGTSALSHRQHESENPYSRGPDPMAFSFSPRPSSCRRCPQTSGTRQRQRPASSPPSRTHAPDPTSSRQQSVLPGRVRHTTRLYPLRSCTTLPSTESDVWPRQSPIQEVPLVRPQVDMDPVLHREHRPVARTGAITPKNYLFNLV